MIQFSSHPPPPPPSLTSDHPGRAPTPTPPPTPPRALHRLALCLARSLNRSLARVATYVLSTVVSSLEFVFRVQTSNVKLVGSSRRFGAGFSLLAFEPAFTLDDSSRTLPLLHLSSNFDVLASFTFRSPHLGNRRKCRSTIRKISSRRPRPTA